MENTKKTPSSHGANETPLSKSKSHGNYTRPFLTYKELCDSTQTASQENHNGK
jgi:hypothetical protein